MPDEQTTSGERHDSGQRATAVKNSPLGNTLELMVAGFARIRMCDHRCPNSCESGYKNASQRCPEGRYLLSVQALSCPLSRWRERVVSMGPSSRLTSDQPSPAAARRPLPVLGEVTDYACTRVNVGRNKRSTCLACQHFLEPSPAGGRGWSAWGR